MGITAFEVFAKLTIDKGDFDKGLDAASTQTSGFADKLKAGLGGAAKVGAAALTAVTTATAALTGAIIKGTGDIASYGDNIDKMSQKMGLSAEAYQEWDAVMQHSGTSIESLQAGMKTLANAVESGNKAFDRLGISQEQIASMDNEELFSATITALQNVDNETERTYLAGQLLGRGATELGALLNTSAEDTQAMKDRVHELGGVMSDEAVKAAAEYQDSLQDMQTAFSGVSRGLLSGFLPSVTTVMDGLTEIFSGNGSKGVSLVREGMSGLAENMTQSIPRIVEVGGQILGGLSAAMIDSLPLIVQAGTQALVTLADSIMSNLPSMLSTAAQIVAAVAASIGAALPQLLETGGQMLDQLTAGIESGLPDMLARLPQIITGLINFLAGNLPGITEKGFDILIALVDGIIEAIPDLVAALPDVIAVFLDFFTTMVPAIITKGGELLGHLIAGILGAIPEIAVQLPAVISAIADALKAGWETIKDAGKYLLEGLWAGISDKIQWLKDKVGGVVNTIKSWFTGKDGFDEHSPSKWANQVFQRLMEGGGAGIQSGLPGLMSSVDSAVSQVKNGFDFGTTNVDFASSGLGRSSAAIVNSVSSAGQQAAEPGAPVTVNLVLPDGSKFASWQLPYLIKAGAANGTPIANGQVG